MTFVESQFCRPSGGELIESNCFSTQNSEFWLATSLILELYKKGMASFRWKLKTDTLKRKAPIIKKNRVPYSAKWAELYDTCELSPKNDVYDFQQNPLCFSYILSKKHTMTSSHLHSGYRPFCASCLAAVQTNWCCLVMPKRPSMQMQCSSFARTIAIRAYCQLYYCAYDLS